MNVLLPTLIERQAVIWYARPARNETSKWRDSSTSRAWDLAAPPPPLVLLFAIRPTCSYQRFLSWLRYQHVFLHLTARTALGVLSQFRIVVFYSIHLSYLSPHHHYHSDVAGIGWRYGSNLRQLRIRADTVAQAKRTCRQRRRGGGGDAFPLHPPTTLSSAWTVIPYYTFTPVHTASHV